MASRKPRKINNTRMKKYVHMDVDSINPKKEINILDSTEALVQYYRKWITDFEKDRKKLEMDLDRLTHVKSHAACDVEREDLLRKLYIMKQEIFDFKTSFDAEQRQSLKLLHCNESLKGDLCLMEKKLTIIQSITEVSDEELDAFCKSAKITKLLKSRYRFKLRAVKEQLQNFSENIVDDSPQVHVLKGKLNLLEAEKHESEKLFMKEIDALREEKALRTTEFRALQEENQAQRELLISKLDNTEEMVLEKQKRINSLVSEKQQLQERKFAEIDRILSATKRGNTYTDQENNRVFYMRDTPNREECPAILRRRIAKLEKQLKDEEELRKSYESRCGKFEQRLCKLEEENEIAEKHYQDKLKNCKEQLQLSENQKSKLAFWKRKQFEGFSSDLKILKDQLKKVIQQLFKITNYFSSDVGQISKEKLCDIKTASSLARTVHLTLVDSRKRLIQMETKSPDDG